MWTTSELPGVRVITSCFKWKAEKSIKIVTKHHYLSKHSHISSHKCFQLWMFNSRVCPSHYTNTVPQVKQANNTSVPSAYSVNYWITLIFFRGQQRTNSLLARISALRNGPREGAGYKSLSNISIFYFTLQLLEQDLTVEKNQQLILCSAIEQLANSVEQAWLAIKTSLPWDVCTNEPMFIHRSGWRLWTHGLLFHLPLFSKHLRTAANRLSDLRCCDPGIPEHSLQRRTFSYTGKCYNFGHPV